MTELSSPPYNLSTEEIKQNIQARWQAGQAQRDRRRKQGWHLARQAAALLKQDFQVERVVAFGSLVHAERFTQWSDVDIAAWGLTEENWLRAILAVYELSSEIELNLVDARNCSLQLLETIEREGIEL